MPEYVSRIILLFYDLQIRGVCSPICVCKVWYAADGSSLYLLGERTGIIIHYDISAKGDLSERKGYTASYLPDQKSVASSEIALSSDQRHLYAANRKFYTIAIFAVSKDGELICTNGLRTE